MGCENCGDGTSKLIRSLSASPKGVDGPDCPQRSWCSFLKCVEDKAGASANLPPEFLAEMNALKARIAALENNTGLTVDIPAGIYGVPLSGGGANLPKRDAPSGSGGDGGFNVFNFWSDNSIGRAVMPASGTVTGIATYILPEQLSSGMQYTLDVRKWAAFGAFLQYSATVQIGPGYSDLNIPVLVGEYISASISGSAGAMTLDVTPQAQALTAGSGVQTAAIQPREWVGDYNDWPNQDGIPLGTGEFKVALATVILQAGDGTIKVQPSWSPS